MIPQQPSSATAKVAFVQYPDLPKISAPALAEFSSAMAEWWSKTRGVLVRRDSASAQVQDFDKLLGATTADALPAGIVNFYFTESKFTELFALKSTSDLAEGTRLYFTTARATANFNSNFASAFSASFTTTFPGAFSAAFVTSFPAAFDAAFSAKTSDDLTEGATNLFFTTARGNTNFAANFTTALGALHTWSAVQTFGAGINVGLAAASGSDFSADYSGIDNAQPGTPYAQLTDLNDLRAKCANLEAIVEDIYNRLNA